MTNGSRTRTALSAGAAALIERAWLAALVITPLFFNTHSQGIFEEDKIPLLRSLALLIVAAAGLWAIDEGGARLRTAVRRWWRAPLVKPACVLTAVYLVSTLLSIAPRISWSGAHERCQGTYTWLSYVVMFGAVTTVARRRDQVNRIVSAAVLASVPVALYALVQYVGMDPIVWAPDLDHRVFSTAGNPIFLSAFVIMVIPLTLVRTVEEVSRLTEDRPGRVKHGFVAGGYLTVLLLQFLTILLSKSRGPFLALGAALAFFLVALAAQRGRRTLAVAALVMMVVVGGSLAVIQIRRAASARSNESISRLGALDDVHGGSSQVRILIWQGVATLLKAHPLRALIGYGPETFVLAFGAAYPHQLLRFHPHSTMPDRAHNETFDSLVTTGVVGCAAEIALFVAFFVLGWRQLGLIRSNADRNRLVALMVLGGIIGGCAPMITDRSVRFSGVAIPCGMVAGLLVHFALAVKQARIKRPTDLLIVGLLAAVLGHWIEMQVGIATASTRLYFWIYLALAVVIERVESIGDAGSASSANPLAAQAESATDSRWRMRIGYLAMSAVGAVALVLALNFYSPHPGNPAVIARTANAVSLAYLTIFAVLIVSSVVGGVPTWRSTGTIARRPAYAGLAAPALALGLLFTVLYTNLNSSRADVFSKQAALAAERGDGTTAFLGYTEAVRLQPTQDWYVTDVGRFLMVVATGAPRERRESYLAQAQVAFERARALSPLNADHPRNLARLHRVWGGLLEEPGERARHVEQAETSYREATALQPHNAALYTEWAELYAEFDQPAQALAMVRRSLAVDERYAPAYALRAAVLLHIGQARAAVADCARALRLEAGLLAAARTNAQALDQLGRLDESITKLEVRLRKTPSSFARHRDLAFLYEQRGQRDLALAELRASLPLAHRPVRPHLEQQIVEWQQAPAR